MAAADRLIARQILHPFGVVDLAPTGFYPLPAEQNAQDQPHPGDPIGAVEEKDLDWVVLEVSDLARIARRV